MKAMLHACRRVNAADGEYYYKVSSKRMRTKEVCLLTILISCNESFQLDSHAQLSLIFFNICKNVRSAMYSLI